MRFPAVGNGDGMAGSAFPRVMCDAYFSAATLGMLRERVAACAAAAGMPRNRASDVTLAVHEMAANAVRHGPGTGRLVISDAGGGRLACQVSDAGAGADPWPVQPGHGLWIVRNVADEMTVASSPADGSHVTAVFSNPDGPA